MPLNNFKSYSKSSPNKIVNEKLTFIKKLEEPS
jgi:hypothetical protein